MNKVQIVKKINKNKKIKKIKVVKRIKKLKIGNKISEEYNINDNDTKFFVLKKIIFFI